MANDMRLELTSLLEILPPVEFCCIYGSSLHPNNSDKTSMIDYIIGVADPRQWHAENLEKNPSHYASWMMRLGGARLITDIADDIGVGVHFNPFITHNNKDILGWERFYLSGRLQKPEELYAKICGLSYTGDIRMLFAEDKNKVKKIVQGQFNLFQTMYKPILEEYAAQELLRLPSSLKVNIMQLDKELEGLKDCELSTVSTLVSSLPWQLRSLMGSKLGEKRVIDIGGVLDLHNNEANIIVLIPNKAVVQKSQEPPNKSENPAESEVSAGV